MPSKKTTRNADTVDSGKRVASWRDRAMASVNRQKKQADKLPTGGGGDFLSFKGGVLSLGGATLANPLRVVVIDFQAERAYYDEPFRPGEKTSPACYSYDLDEPHEKAKNKQSDKCLTCEWNQFGTSENGRGKACKEGARVVFMAADQLDNPAEAKLVQGRLSVTNSRIFDRFVRALGETATWQVSVDFHVKGHPTNQYEVAFRDVESVDEDALDALSARVGDAEALLSAPYPEFDETPAPKGRAPARRFARGK